MSAEPAPLASSLPEAAPSTNATVLRSLATSLAVVSIAEVLGILLFASVRDARFPIGADIFSIGFLASVILFPTIGALIVQRRPTTRVAWFMIAAGIGLGLALLTSGYAVTGMPPAPARPFALQVLAVSQLLFVPSIASGTVLLILHFPTDRLPSPRWRLVVAMALVGTALYLAGTALRPGDFDSQAFPGIHNPLGVPAAWEPVVAVVGGVGNAMLTAAVFLAAISLILRYRRADPVEAAQIRWIVFVACIATPAFAISSFPSPISEGAFGIGLLGLAAMPIAIGIAITRYHLYDIDRLINRTLVYGALTAILTGVFTAGVGLAQRVFVGLTGESSDAAIVLTTLVVATLYAPLRKRLESFVDLRFKYDEHRFGAYRSELKQLLSLVEPIRGAERLAAEAVRELHATGSAVVDAKDRPIATAGEWPAPAAVRLPISGGAGGAHALLIGPRRGGEPHDPRAIAELEEVVALAASAIVRS